MSSRIDYDARVSVGRLPLVNLDPQNGANRAVVKRDIR
jgi:hypothetical protein